MIKFETNKQLNQFSRIFMINQKSIIRLMKSKPILIVSGDPKSIFFEIFIKSIKSNKYRSPLILISSIKLLKLNLKKYKYKKVLEF